MSEEHDRHRLKFMLRQQGHIADLSITKWLSIIAEGQHPHGVDGIVAQALQDVAAGQYAACMSDVRYAYGNDPADDTALYERHTFAFGLIAQVEGREVGDSDCFLSVTERKATEEDWTCAESPSNSDLLARLSKDLEGNEFLNDLTLGVCDLVTHIGSAVLEKTYRVISFSLSGGGATVAVNHLVVPFNPENLKGSGKVITLTYHMKQLHELQKKVEAVFDKNGELRQKEE